jgi:hypothetical protein
MKLTAPRTAQCSSLASFHQTHQLHINCFTLDEEKPNSVIAQPQLLTQLLRFIRETFSEQLPYSSKLAIHGCNS